MEPRFPRYVRVDRSIRERILSNELTQGEQLPRQHDLAAQYGVARDLTMPQFGLTMTEGTVTRWFKREGDEVAVDEPVLEIETDKLTNEVAAPITGRLAGIVAPEGSTHPVGAVLAVIAAPGEQISAAPAQPPPAPPGPPPFPANQIAIPAVDSRPPPIASEEEGRVFSSAAARRLARELGVDWRSAPDPAAGLWSATWRRWPGRRPWPPSP